MMINTEIADVYIAGRSLNCMREHWIFHSIVNGQCLLEEPINIQRTKIELLLQSLYDCLRNFEPLNKCVWDSFFGSAPIPDNTRVYLVARSPEPYDAMVRDDPDGNNCIILDLIRLASYSEDMAYLSELAAQFVTHEFAHILINERYPHPQSDASLFDILKHIVFDEGIAHFLSFRKDVLSTDWYTDEMNMRREKSYQTLISVLNTDRVTDKERIIIDSNSGVYWEKFAAIAGLFALADYYSFSGKNLIAFTHLYSRGPDFLFDFIVNESHSSGTVYR